MELACKVRNRKVGLTVDATHSGGPQKGVMYEPGLYKCRMQGSATSAPPAALTAPTNPNSAPKQGAPAPKSAPYAQYGPEQARALHALPLPLQLGRPRFWG